MRDGYELTITVGLGPDARPATPEEAARAVAKFDGVIDDSDYGWDDVDEVYVASFPDDVADELDDYIEGVAPDGLDGWWVEGSDTPGWPVDVEVMTA